MGITSKTRKILWARSGNRCAICRKELITSEKSNVKATVVGEECQIISKKDDGPRGDSKAKIEHDEFDNLILLCLEHHKVIDENEDEHTVEKLREIKRKHEAWVEKKLKEEKKHSPFILPRIESGQDIARILSRVHVYYFFNEDFDNDDEAKLVAGFFQNLQDWGDFLPDLGVGETIEIGQTLQNQINELKEDGFLLFGEVSKKRINSLGEIDVATFSICKETSQNIIKWDEILKKMEKTEA